jgi:hypothetical protein
VFGLINRIVFLSSHTSAAIEPLRIDARSALISIWTVVAGGVDQCLRQIVPDFGILSGAHTQTVRPPGFNPHGLMSQVPDKCLILPLKACQDSLLNRCFPVPIDSLDIQTRVQRITQAVAK